MPAAALLSLSNITKRYPGVVALDRVDLTLEPGSVHALLGENGAGKSTLLKVLAGAEQPDEGTVEFAGRTVAFRGPRDALRLGITVIYQELSLVPELSACANIMLGMEPARRGVLDRLAERERASAALSQLGATFDPGTVVSGLSMAERQLVELARALVREARVVALDEPTAALSQQETLRLFERVRSLRESGLAVVFVTHRLEEVRRIADRITVLRDGRRIWSGKVSEISDAAVIRHMVGRDVEMERLPAAAAAGETVLEVRALTRTGLFTDVSLALRRGEIVALAGLMGAGRTEVARCLAGADRPDSGQLLVRGAEFKPMSPREAIRRGIVYLPEERKLLGLVLGMTVRENTTLPVLERFARLGVVARRAEAGAAAAQVAALAVRPPDLERPVATLSGGNQQKVVMAKWLLADAPVLIVDEPTRGVDVAAKSEIHRRIRALADAGKAVLLISSELPEVLALADRILVMCEGRLRGELSGEHATPEAVLSLALPGSGAVAA